DAMGERPSRGCCQRNRRIRPRKADTVPFVCVCGWLYFKSFAAAPSTRRIDSPALDRTKARDLDLWRRQIIQGHPGTGVIEALSSVILSGAQRSRRIPACNLL